MTNRSPPLTEVFQALADPTRFAVVERLSRGPTSTSELAKPFDMALPSFTQHMNMLEKIGLVHSRKTGRVRIYELAPRPLKAAEDWMSSRRTLWERRLDQLDEVLLDLKEDPR